MYTNISTRPDPEAAIAKSFDSVVLGTTIKLLRERNNMTQQELGKLTNISPAELSKIENGTRKKIPLENLIRISPYLNVSLDHLLTTCSNSHNDRERFYDYEGKEIDIYWIAKNIYFKDAELLLMLSKNDVLSDRETLSLFKSWIKLKRKLSNSDKHKKLLTSFINYCYNFIQALATDE